MSPITYFLLLSTISLSLAASDILPDQFIGTFDLDHSENFDEYLTAKGYNFFIRKIVSYASVQKVFARSSDKTKFDYSNLTSKKNVYYKNIVLGAPFNGEGLDSTTHEITFSLKNGHLLEHHKPLEGGEFQEETFDYVFQGNDLVLSMSYGGIEARRFFKRTA